MINYSIANYANANLEVEKVGSTSFHGVCWPLLQVPLNRFSEHHIISSQWGLDGDWN